ncbi:MAG: cellulase family glycosylhydrolase [Sphingobacteriia bacterium]|nr:cellulase family glycosylhydrolase [Sphingobacteriia bacterium]
MIRQIILITFICTLSLSTFSAKLTGSQPLTELVKQLGAGINISLFEHNWSTPQQIWQEDYLTKLKKIKKAHFKTVRFPIAFDMFLQPNSTNLMPEILLKMQEIYTNCKALNLNLVFTYHYGKLTDYNSFSEQEKVSWIWKQVQRRFTGEGYETLFFELYNEPTINAGLWKSMAETLIRYLRYEDKDRVYIVGGTNYNNIEELRTLGRINDNRTLYTFHFYEPFIFTHQGAEWEADKTYITGIPYPYKQSTMPPLPKKARGTDVEENFNKYKTEGTQEYLSNKITSALHWCNLNNMILICTETGVIGNVRNADRERYLKDVTNILNSNGIAAMLWDYDQKFTVTKPNGKPIKPVRKWIKHS